MSLIVAQDIKDYTVFKKVKDRDPSLLLYDIIQAEKDVFKICNHKFDDPILYATLPQEVKLALIKLAEYYALVNSDEARVKGIQSESLENYSYTLSNGSTVTKPDILTLLEDYMVGSPTKGRIRFRLGAI